MEDLGIKLPNDPSMWDGIILSELGKKSPSLASTVGAVDIKESDYTNGNLTGLIVAANGRVLIPLVVRGFRIKPLDVIIYGDKIMALTDRTVDSTLFSPSVSDGKLVNPQDLQTGTDISRLLSPPDSTSGGFTTPPGYSNKIASSKISILDALKVASDSTRSKFAAKLTSDSLLLEKVAMLLPLNDILGEISRPSRRGGGGPAEKTASCERHDALYIRNIGGVYMANGVEKKAEELVGLPEDAKASLLLAGEALVAPEDSKAEVTILTKKGLIPLKNTAIANVICKEGDSLSGVFLSNVISFDHNPTHKGLFLSGNKQWIYQEQLVGVMLNSADEGSSIGECLDKLQEMKDTPKIGEYGTFILDRKAIEPFRVISLYSVAGSTIMSVASLSGQRLVVEYRDECGEAFTDQKPLMVASGKLVSKYFPTDRLYIVSMPYQYVSLKAQRHGARMPEEALTPTLDVKDGCIMSIKKASGGYVVSEERQYEARRISDLLPSKLACQYELAQYGIGSKQAGVLVDMSPVSFVVKKSADELPNRHSGAELPETVPQSPPPLLTNNTNTSGGQGSQLIDQGSLNTASMLNDPETLNLLLTVGMGEIDDKVRQYVASNVGDIHGLIDKLGRLLLIIRTSKDTGISESAIGDLVQKLDRSAWELNDFSGRKQPAEEQ